MEELLQISEEKLAKEQKNNDLLSSKVSGLKTENAFLERELGETKELLDKMTHELAQIKSRENEVDCELEELKEKLRVKDLEIKDATEKIAEMEEELIILKETVDETECGKIDMQENYEKEQKELKEEIEMLKKLMASLAQSQKKKGSLENEQGAIVSNELMKSVYELTGTDKKGEEAIKTLIAQLNRKEAKIPQTGSMGSTDTKKPMTLQNKATQCPSLLPKKGDSILKTKETESNANPNQNGQGVSSIFPENAHLIFGEKPSSLLKTQKEEKKTSTMKIHQKKPKRKRQCFHLKSI